jgi:hypothetical protein
MFKPEAGEGSKIAAGSPHDRVTNKEYKRHTVEQELVVSDELDVTSMTVDLDVYLRGKEVVGRSFQVKDTDGMPGTLQARIDPDGNLTISNKGVIFNKKKKDGDGNWEVENVSSSVTLPGVLQGEELKHVPRLQKELKNKAFQEIRIDRDKNDRSGGEDIYILMTRDNGKTTNLQSWGDQLLKCVMERFVPPPSDIIE